jgi:hypothetical protein
VEGRSRYPSQYKDWQTTPADFVIDGHAPVGADWLVPPPLLLRGQGCWPCALATLPAVVLQLLLQVAFPTVPVLTLLVPQVRELWYRASLAWREILGSDALGSQGLVVAHNAGGRLGRGHRGRRGGITAAAAAGHATALLCRSTRPPSAGHFMLGPVPRPLLQ